MREWDARENGSLGRMDGPGYIGFLVAAAAAVFLGGGTGWLTALQRAASGLMGGVEAPSLPLAQKPLRYWLQHSEKGKRK